jgi:predicted transcriptional regulator
MTSKTIFNMNTQLKKAAMKKARQQGWTLSAMLNFATRAYVEDRLNMEILDPELARGLDDIKNGRVITLEEAERRLQSRLGKR